MDTQIIKTSCPCHVCDKDIEMERVQLGLDVCKECAFQINPPKLNHNIKRFHLTDLEDALTIQDKNLNLGG